MSRPPRLLRTQAGSLLIVTLWIVTILVVLVVAIARTLSLEVRLTKYHLAREQARALARSGIYVAMERLRQDVADDEQYDWLGDEDWAGEIEPVSDRTGTGTVEMSITDEERKLNVNAATVDQLAQLSGSSDVANALVDYRDPDGDGAWEAVAVVEERVYYPKNAPLVAPEELQEIPEQMTDTRQALEEFTVAVPEPAPSAKVNINTAPLEVLAAVLVSAQPDDETLRTEARTLASAIADFCSKEKGHYFKTLSPVKADSPLPSDLDPNASAFQNALLKNVLQVHSDTFAIRATGRLNSPKVRHRIDAVVRRGGQDVRIIAWREY